MPSLRSLVLSFTPAQRPWRDSRVARFYPNGYCAGRADAPFFPHLPRWLQWLNLLAPHRPHKAHGRVGTFSTRDGTVYRTTPTGQIVKVATPTKGKK